MGNLKNFAKKYNLDIKNTFFYIYNLKHNKNDLFVNAQKDKFIFLFIHKNNIIKHFSAFLQLIKPLNNFTGTNESYFNNFINILFYNLLFPRVYNLSVHDDIKLIYYDIGSYKYIYDLSQRNNRKLLNKMISDILSILYNKKIDNCRILFKTLNSLDRNLFDKIYKILYNYYYHNSINEDDIEFEY